VGRRSSPLVAWGAIVLLLVYVVPLFAPPGPVASPRLGLEVGLWQRLFPHVPGWWVAGRLFALAAGAVMLGWQAGVGGALVRWQPEMAAGSSDGRVPVRILEWAALGMAAALALAGSQMHHLSRSGQFALILGLGLPAALLHLADRQQGSPRQRLTPSEGTVSVVALAVVWVFVRVVWAAHDPRAADFVDVWKNFTIFLGVANDTSAAVTQSAEMGVSNAYLLLLGVPLLGPGKIAPSFVWLQRVHAIWIVLTVWGVGCLVRRIVGAWAMLPAAATLLCSPFMLSMAVSAVPFGIATALGVAIMLLVCRIYEAGRRADVAILGAIGGFAITFPHLAVWMAAAVVAVLPCLVRQRPPLIVWMTAACLGLASVVPMLITVANVSGMSELYLQRRGVIAELEPIIMGQRYLPLQEIGALWYQGVRGVWDVPLGTLLQPFAILRTPVRLSGDVYFEPIGAALAAVGIVVCAGMMRQRPAARCLLAALAVALLPGMLGSAFDRASLTRNLMLPVMLPVFTAIGLQGVRRALRLEWSAMRLGVATAAVMAIAGVLLFDVVNPRIVAGSWLGLTLQATGSTPADRVLILEPGHPRWEWLYAPEIARYVPAAPLRTRPYRNAGSLLDAPELPLPAAPVLFWSPALEEEESVQQAICRCWPSAEVFVVRDVAGLSRVLAARVDGPEWEPAVAQARWSRLTCAGRSPLPAGCDGVRALAYLNRGSAAAEARRLDEAQADFATALQLDPTNARAVGGLGEVLAARGQVDAAIDRFREALHFDPALAGAHNGLALMLERRGDIDEALVHYREVVRLSPRDFPGRLNLGAVLAGRGQIDAALEQFAEVTRLFPEMPEAHQSLAEALVLKGQAQPASTAYRAALAARPGWPPAVAGLALLLATTDDPTVRNPAAAIAMATAALPAVGQPDAGVLRALAAGHASAGQFDAAITVGERAVAAARGAGQDDLVRDLEARLVRYRDRRR
jgi:tetratricopeptide (TPR) repeat protein